nr:hypothetical protein [Navicula sp.]
MLDLLKKTKIINVSLILLCDAPYFWQLRLQKSINSVRIYTSDIDYQNTTYRLRITYKFICSNLFKKKKHQKKYLRKITKKYNQKINFTKNFSACFATPVLVLNGKKHQYTTVRGMCINSPGNSKRRPKIITPDKPIQPSKALMESFQKRLQLEFDVPGDKVKPVHYRQPVSIENPDPRNKKRAPKKYFGSTLSQPQYQNFRCNKHEDTKYPSSYIVEIQDPTSLKPSEPTFHKKSEMDVPFMHYDHNTPWELEYHYLTLDVGLIHEKGLPRGYPDLIAYSNNQIIRVNREKFLERMDQADRCYEADGTCTVRFKRTNITYEDECWARSYESNYKNYESRLDRLLTRAKLKAPNAVQVLNFPARDESDDRYCFHEEIWYAIPDIPKTVTFDILNDGENLIEDKILSENSINFKKASKKFKKPSFKLVQVLSINFLAFSIVTILIDNFLEPISIELLLSFSY